MIDANFITDEEYLKREKERLAKRGLQIVDKNIVLKQRYYYEMIAKLIGMLATFFFGFLFGVLASRGI